MQDGKTSVPFYLQFCEAPECRACHGKLTCECNHWSRNVVEIPGWMWLDLIGNGSLWFLKFFFTRLREGASASNMNTNMSQWDEDLLTGVYSGPMRWGLTHWSLLWANEMRTYSLESTLCQWDEDLLTGVYSGPMRWGLTHWSLLWANEMRTYSLESTLGQWDEDLLTLSLYSVHLPTSNWLINFLTRKVRHC